MKYRFGPDTKGQGSQGKPVAQLIVLQLWADGRSPLSQSVVVSRRSTARIDADRRRQHSHSPPHPIGKRPSRVCQNIYSTETVRVTKDTWRVSTDTSNPIQLLKLCLRHAQHFNLSLQTFKNVHLYLLSKMISRQILI